MKLNLKKLMKNQMVLYVLAFLSLTNVVSFLASNDLEAAILFVALVVLTSHFTKNRSTTLLVALLVTHLMKRRVREGMKENLFGDISKAASKAKKKAKRKAAAAKRKAQKKAAAARRKAEESMETDDETDDEIDENFSSGKIDQAATLKKAYSNLDNVLGKDGMNGVTKDTAALIQQQQQLMNQIESATPVLNNAMKMMESKTFQKIANGEHMKGMENMTEMMSKFGFNGKN